MTEPDREWMTVPEAAEWLGVGERQLRAELRAGVVPHHRIGDRYLVSRAGLRAWAEEQGRLTARLNCTPDCTDSPDATGLPPVYQRSPNTNSAYQRTRNGQQGSRE